MVMLNFYELFTRLLKGIPKIPEVNRKFHELSRFQHDSRGRTSMLEVLHGRNFI